LRANHRQAIYIDIDLSSICKIYACIVHRHQPRLTQVLRDRSAKAMPSAPPTAGFISCRTLSADDIRLWKNLKPLQFTEITTNNPAFYFSRVFDDLIRRNNPTIADTQTYTADISTCLSTDFVYIDTCYKSILPQTWTYPMVNRNLSISGIFDRVPWNLRYLSRNH